MAGKPSVPYHLDEQYADALLQPIAAILRELEQRAAQYADRLHLSEDDRNRVEKARDLIIEMRLELEALVKVPERGAQSKVSS